MAARLGLTATDVVDNVVTALTSNGMIAPSYWVDPHSGNNYFLTVQYTNHQLERHDHGGFQADSAARQGQQQHHHAGECRRHQDDQHADRGRPLPAIPQDRCLCFAEGRRPGRALQQGAEAHRRYQASAEHPRGDARIGQGHAAVVPQLRYRAAAGDCAGLPDPDGAVRLVHRSVHHPAGDSVRHHRRDPLPAGHRIPR